MYHFSVKQFLEARAEIKDFFDGFWEELKPRKIAFDIF